LLCSNDRRALHRRRILMTPGHMRRAARELARAAWAPACSSARSLAPAHATRLAAPLVSSPAVGGARVAGPSRSFASSAPASRAAGDGAGAGGARGGPPRFATLLGAAALGFGGYHLLPDARKSEAQFAIFSALSPLFRLTDAETAHELGIELLARGVAPLEMRSDDERLRVTLWNQGTGKKQHAGVTFPNPVGLAAGFDKDAKAFPALLGSGFGFVEIGSVTPKPQPGNPKPRVFRLPEHAAVINRYGFNSEGHEPAELRLRAYREAGNPTQYKSRREKKDAGGAATESDASFSPPLGVNLGKNKLTPEALAYEDYVEGVRALGAHADYLVVNVSSPNTPGLRDLQSKKFLEKLMRKVREARDSLPDGHRPPVLLKIAPDLTERDVRDVASAARKAKVDGIIVSNTTIERPDGVRAHPHGGEAGGLSGAPLMDASTEMLRLVYSATGGAIPLVGCGGVSDGKDAYRKIRAGASLVQLYTAFAYQGPGMLPKMKKELLECLDKDGFASVREAVGADHRERR
jgi:dihydroorotate dehydrogenase